MGKSHPETYSKEKMAIVVGRAIPVSMKQCVEISFFIRGKKLSTAKKLLEEVLEMKRAVPFKRYNRDIGHRKGRMDAGRYPIKACKYVLALLNSVESNAQFKGLNTNALFINHMSSYNASRPWHSGRQKRRRVKSTNIEIMVAELETSNKENKSRKEKQDKNSNKENKGNSGKKDNKENIQNKNKESKKKE